MKSISALPQMSGGATWTTGSPRSSERQISPRRNSSGDTKPRSRRSASLAVERLARRLVLHELDAPEEPGAADVADDRQLAQRLELRRGRSPAAGDVLQDLLALEDLDALERDGAAAPGARRR